MQRGYNEGRKNCCVGRRDSMSTMIETGFLVDPSAGALQSDDLLCRYVPSNRFIDLIKSSSIWYSRIDNWKIDDPLEGILIPSFSEALAEPHESDATKSFLTARTELYLRSSFACCFMEYSGKDEQHMWDTFCPDGSGAMFVVRAQAVASAMQRTTCTKFFRKVEYIAAEDREGLKIEQIDHAMSTTSSGYLHPGMSYFLKDDRFRAEREVRSVLSPGTFDRSLLYWFFGRNKLVLERHTEVPDMNNIPEGELWLCYEGDGVFDLFKLSEEKTRELTEAITTNFHQTFPTLVAEPGIKVPFHLETIEKIVLSPDLQDSNVRDSELWKCIRDAGLSSRAKIGFHE